MLGVGDATAVNEACWRGLPTRTRLPWSWRQFVADASLGRGWPDSRRRFERAPLRVRVILRTADVEYAAYAKDVSRLGVGFYSPVHVLPKQMADLELLNGKTLKLRVTRCRRLGPNCFECGSLFELPAPKKRVRRYT
jgi:hypothetical protein